MRTDLSFNSDYEAEQTKMKKRFCYTCEIEFRRLKDFLSHLRGHVTLPYLYIEKLPDDNPFVRAYFNKIENKNEIKSPHPILKVKNIGSMMCQDSTSKKNESKSDSRPLYVGIKIKQEIERDLRSKNGEINKIINNDNQTSISNQQIDQNVSTKQGLGKLYNESPIGSINQFSNDKYPESSEIIIPNNLANNFSNTNSYDTDPWLPTPVQNEFISLDAWSVCCSDCNVTFENETQLMSHQQATGHNFPLNHSNSYVPNRTQYSSNYQPFEPNLQQQRMGMQMRFNYPTHSLVNNHPNNIANSLAFPANQHNVQNDHYPKQHPEIIYSSPDIYNNCNQMMPNYSNQHEAMTPCPPASFYRGPPPHQVRAPVNGPPPNAYRFEKFPQGFNRANNGRIPDIPDHTAYMKTQMQTNSNSNLYQFPSKPRSDFSSPPTNLRPPTQIRPRFMPPQMEHNITRHPSVQYSMHPQQQYQPKAKGVINVQESNILRTSSSNARPQTSVLPSNSIMPKPSTPIPVNNMENNCQIKNCIGVAKIRPYPEGNMAIKHSTIPYNERDSSQSQPLMKKFKIDLKQTKIDFKPSRLVSQSIQDNQNIPIIKRVVTNNEKLHSCNGQVSHISIPGKNSPVQINDQVTLTSKSSEPKKDPKEVANLLAIRGITVIQKGGTKMKDTTDSLQKMNGPNSNSSSATKEAVQKLQLNSSVSIISKRKIDESIPSKTYNSANNRNEDNNDKMPTIENETITSDSNISVTKQPLVTEINIEKAIQTSVIKCKICPALFSNNEDLKVHEQNQHEIFHNNSCNFGIPIVDLRNESTRNKLASLGIKNVIPLFSKSSADFFGFPIVSIEDENLNEPSLSTLGASSVLSLGPLKSIPKL